MRKALLTLIIVTLYAVNVIIIVHGIDHWDSDRAVSAVVNQASIDHQNDLMRINALEAELSIIRQDNDDLRAKVQRASRSRRAAPPTMWAHSVRGNKIANCESADLQHWPWSDGSRYLGGDKGVHLRDPNGHYGKWQFDLSTWRSVGGTGNPADASEQEQDARAELLYNERREQPWACARMV